MSSMAYFIAFPMESASMSAEDAINRNAVYVIQNIVVFFSTDPMFSVNFFIVPTDPDFLEEDFP